MSNTDEFPEVIHREDEYDSSGFGMLFDMQNRHFWYRGRHRFLLHSVCQHVKKDSRPRVIDLGGGCGGWLNYLAQRNPFEMEEMALADSSPLALQMASPILPPGTGTYQIDLLKLPWTARWDLAFLLDVLEHIPDHEEVLRQTYRSLAPGGLLFVTTPALNFFWSWNDEIVHHVRRYSRNDFCDLAGKTGFRLLQTRYFMFFLSPLLLGARLVTRPDIRKMSREEIESRLQKMHEVPRPWINNLLTGIFAMETPLGHLLPFPWGTSVLAVLQKP